MKNEINRALVAKKKLFSLFAALTLSVGLWAETVSYLYPVYNTDGDPASGIKEWQSTTVDATEITSSSATLAAGWYVVKGTDVQTGTLTCQGAVHIILADGAKLTATGSANHPMQTSTPGIQVSGTGNSLTIYAQSTGEQMGQLVATGGFNAAGIGNGWGSPDPGSNITINGGTITAIGINEAAGIGSGKDGYCSNIAINGGTVEASGGYSGIGGWSWGSSDIFVATNLVIKAGKEAKDAQVIINDVIDLLANKLAGKQYVTIEPLIATSYINEKGEAKTADAIEVNSIQGYWGAGSHTTWYVVTGENVTLSGAICAGNVNLILADGAKLTVKGSFSKAGIQVSGDGTSLTIYAQSTGDQMGQLIATSQSSGAGIGGGDGGYGSNITINGGVIEATGGSNGAGIGGGRGGYGSYITINGGTVRATGSDGAGIGGGNQGYGSNITINGGTVRATGSDGAGIGGGNQGYGSNITINGGTVTATGDWNGAGIGGSYAGSGSDITINGGVIEATGGDMAAGIGGGSGGDGSNITISGGTVTATGGEEDAAGIGGGEYGSGSYITISGGTVETTGGSNGAGIGGGSNSGSYITISGGTVTATGGDGAAGIGGGLYGSGSDITISGGTVTATGGSNGAGIGGGDSDPGFNITISGGTVTANGGYNAAGIGSGQGSLDPGSNITISGGTVIANGGEDAAGIGNGYDGDDPAFDIFVATSLVVKADGNNPPTTVITNTGDDLASSLAGKQYAIVVPTTYTRDNLGNGKFGTICLAYAVADLEGVGATFYKLNYFDESASALYLEEVDALAAGMPYIFEAKAESFTVTLIAAAPADADNENGLYGTLAEVVKTSDDIHSYAAISNNQVNVAENGNTVTVAANRAYIDMNEVSTTELAHSAPLRAIGVPRQTPTGNPSLHHSINSHTRGASLKIIEDGQFRIVREGKTYNAQGTLIIEN
ncbi:MAG: hypothetical protein MJZ58_03170 [Paludibacteraceae bacterium]|nr:hypothetical protein [Paludibacteraceae bacterium]